MLGLRNLGKGEKQTSVQNHLLRTVDFILWGIRTKRGDKRKTIWICNFNFEGKMTNVYSVMYQYTTEMQEQHKRAIYSKEIPGPHRPTPPDKNVPKCISVRYITHHGSV